MAQETHLPHDIANMENASEEEILKTSRQYGYTRPGKEYFLFRGSDGIVFPSEQEREEWMKNPPPGSTNPFVPPKINSIGMEKYLPSIQKIIDDARALLSSAAKGETYALAYFLDTYFQEAARKRYMTVTSDASSPWHYKIDLNDNAKLGEIPFEDFIYLFGFLLPSLSKNAPIDFSNTKICAECGKFYQAKGKKALYCSERCRSRARAKNKKETEEKE